MNQFLPKLSDFEQRMELHAFKKINQFQAISNEILNLFRFRIFRKMNKYLVNDMRLNLRLTTKVFRFRN